MIRMRFIVAALMMALSSICTVSFSQQSNDQLLMSTPQLKPGINHIAINTVDADATTTFYQEVFGSRLVQKWNKAIGQGSAGRFELPVNVRKLEIAPNTYLFLFVGTGQVLTASQNIGNVHHFTLRVSNVDHTYRKALALGAKPVPFGTLWDGSPANFETQQDDLQIFKCRIAFIEGLNGEIIEIYQDVE